MSENIWIAVIAAIPPTLAAIAALWQARRLARPISEVNNAVNHRAGGQRRLVELVDDIHAEVHQLRDQVKDIKDDLNRHQAWHSDQDESEEP